VKTMQQLIDKPIEGNCFDGRDLNRLIGFMTTEQVKASGIDLKYDYVHTQSKEFTEEAVLEQLKKDVEFGFEKALNKRGLSAGLMVDVVTMWNRILENGLEGLSDTSYAQYGLPVFKATAVKYGFDNPIGKDVGDEYKYSADFGY